MHSHMEVLATYSLVLRFGFVLDIERTFYISTFSKNFVSISKLLLYGFSLSFIGTSFHLLKNNVMFGDGILDGGLFKYHFNLTSNITL